MPRNILHLATNTYKETCTLFISTYVCFYMMYLRLRNSYRYGYKNVVNLPEVLDFAGNISNPKKFNFMENIEFCLWKSGSCGYLLN